MDSIQIVRILSIATVFLLLLLFNQHLKSKNKLIEPWLTLPSEQVLDQQTLYALSLEGDRKWILKHKDDSIKRENKEFINNNWQDYVFDESGEKLLDTFLFRTRLGRI